MLWQRFSDGVLFSIFLRLTNPSLDLEADLVSLDPEVSANDVRKRGRRLAQHFDHRPSNGSASFAHERRARKRVRVKAHSWRMFDV